MAMKKNSNTESCRESGEVNLYEFTIEIPALSPQTLSLALSPRCDSHSISSEQADLQARYDL